MSVLSNVIVASGNAGGIIFHPIMYLKEIHFSVSGTPDNNGAVVQVGFCTSDADPQNVYVTGANRKSYVNLLEGEHTFSINGSIDYFYIAGQEGMSITNLFGILF